MSRSLRKLVGGVGMIVYVLVYCLVAMALADSRPMQEANLFVRTLLYAVLGLAWVPPLMPVIVWMEYGRLRR
ncbi:MAG: DUF2842 domain-containing protein [Roseiarcus sp.]